MADTNANTARLVHNTIMLYGRLLFSLFLSLYTSRAILAALGESDFGIYNVVGGVVAMFSLLTGSMSGAISRFQSFELGNGNLDRLKNAFSAAYMIQAAMAMVIFILVEIVGVWFLNHHMTIDADRMGAAHFVLQCSLITFISSLLIVPSRASVVAHEDLGFFALVSVAEVILKFLIAIYLSTSHVTADKLKIYALLIAASTLVIQLAFSVFCKKKYAECKLTKVTNKSIFKDILSFAGWNMFGSLSNILNSQGVNIVLNIIYGPTVNAARGLATTVNNVVGNFATSFMVALNPQIIKSYAAGEKGHVISLVKRGTKFSFFILFILALPMILEADFLIDLWLVDIPQHTVSFVRLVLILSMVDVLSQVFKMGQEATGIIRNYQLINSAVLLMNFALSYLLLRRGLQPEFTYVISIGVSFSTLIVRALFARKYLELSILDFVWTVFARLSIVVVTSSFVPVVLHTTMNGGLWEFLAVGFSSVICTGISVLTIGCNRGEREFIVIQAKTIMKRVFSEVSRPKKHISA